MENWTVNKTLLIPASFFLFIMLFLVGLVFSGNLNRKKVKRWADDKKPARVTQYSDGYAVGVYCSRGDVESSGESSEYIFTAKQNNIGQVKLSGTVTIEYGHPDCSNND